MSYLVGISGVERWDWDESMVGGRDGRGCGEGGGRREGEGEMWGERERSEILKGCWKYLNQVHTAGDQLPHLLSLRRLSAS